MNAPDEEMLEAARDPVVTPSPRAHMDRGGAVTLSLRVLMCHDGVATLFLRVRMCHDGAEARCRLSFLIVIIARALRLPGERARTDRVQVEA